ncbi:hypothetical protein ACFL5V_03545 [Fibrobacterota bacterium]
MKKLVFGLACLLLLDSFCGTGVTITGFLATARKDYVLDYQDRKIDYLKDNSTNIPFIDEIELRYRNEGFSRSRYALRLSPYGIGETKAGKNVYASTYAYHVTRKAMLLNRALKKRYMLALEYLYRHAMIKLDRELEVVYKDRIDVLNQKSSEINFDFNLLIEAEDDLTRLVLRIIEQKSEITTFEKEISEYLAPGSGIGFDTAEIMDIGFIQGLVEKDTFSLDTGNVYLETSQLELEMSKTRFELENAQTRRYLDFLEFGYDFGELGDQLEDRDRNREYDLNRAINMRLGFTLPFLNSDRLDVNRRKLAYLTDQGRYQDLRLELQNDIRNLLAEMKKYIAQYELLKERTHYITSESSLKTYLQLEGIDPLILLRTKESTLKSKREIEKIKFEVFIAYIRLMDITGRLSKKPLVNLISKSQEPIGQ